MPSFLSHPNQKRVKLLLLGDPGAGKTGLMATLANKDYKVRILDEGHGTDAITRVLIDASDGESVWGTIGVGENVIAASWQALVDSLEFRHQQGRRKGEN